MAETEFTVAYRSPKCTGTASTSGKRVSNCGMNIAAGALPRPAGYLFASSECAFEALIEIVVRDTFNTRP